MGLKPINLETLPLILDGNGQEMIRHIERQSCLISLGMLRGIDE
jgi:hypothetical protein